MKIAMFVDGKGNTLPFYSTGTVELYDQKQGKWVNAKSIPFSITEGMGLGEIRTTIRKMLSELDGCKIFVAAMIKGTPYTILEGMGMSIWKMKGKPVEYLSYIDEEETKLAKERLIPKPSVIGDIRDGIYRINIAEAMEKNGKLTSKRLLLPFILKTSFTRLEVLCDHAPRWFEKEFPAMKLKYDIEVSADGFCHAIISHND